ncbi:hypothetical protein BKA93DRAFT_882652 [Sparassis latifolia]
MDTGSGQVTFNSSDGIYGFQCFENVVHTARSSVNTVFIRANPRRSSIWLTTFENSNSSPSIKGNLLKQSLTNLDGGFVQYELLKHSHFASIQYVQQTTNFGGTNSQINNRAVEHPFLQWGGLMMFRKTAACSTLGIFTLGPSLVFTFNVVIIPSSFRRVKRGKPSLQINSPSLECYAWSGHGYKIGFAYMKTDGHLMLFAGESVVTKSQWYLSRPCEAESTRPVSLLKLRTVRPGYTPPENTCSTLVCLEHRYFVKDYGPHHFVKTWSKFGQAAVPSSKLSTEDENAVPHVPSSTLVLDRHAASESRLALLVPIVGCLRLLLA